MAMNQNWTNQLHFGQNGFRTDFFCQNCLFGRYCCSAENAWPKILLSNLKWLFGQKWLFRQKKIFDRNVFLQKLLFSRKCFLAKNVWTGYLDRDGFLARNVHLPNLIKKSYFSKYWKVWLAFDGWKLSGLFLCLFLIQNLSHNILK